MRPVDTLTPMLGSSYYTLIWETQPPSLPPSSIVTHCGVRWSWEREEAHRCKEPQMGCELPSLQYTSRGWTKCPEDTEEPEEL